MVLFISCVLFLGLGLVVGNRIGAKLAYLQDEGYGLSWKLLGSQLKFEGILDATSYQVWAKASDGKIYSIFSGCDGNPDCNQWIETQGVPDDVHSGLEMEMEEGTTCPHAEIFKYFENPPGNLIKCVRTLHYGMDIMPGWLVYYALTDDGKIWTWSYSNTPTLGHFEFPVLCSCSGLLLGITAFMIFRKRTTQMQVKNQV